MKALYFLPLIALVPSSAFAQGAIAGSARAQSGVPLHGVMVQLASPALIEKARQLLQPLAIMTPRLVRITAEVDF